MKEKNLTVEKLRKDYERACLAYVDKLKDMWELDSNYIEWIRDEIGGVLDYGCGVFTANMDEIIYCVENNITMDDYIRWQEYCSDCIELGFDAINLHSWNKGCPRIPQETFDKIRQMRKDIDDIINQTKNKF